MVDVWFDFPTDGATVPPSFTAIGGSSPPGCTITVTLDCGQGPVAFPVNVDISGNWSAQVSTSAGSGTHCTLCVEATDPTTGQKKKVCITVTIGSTKS